MSQEGSLPSLSKRRLSVIKLLLSMCPFHRILRNRMKILFFFVDCILALIRMNTRFGLHIFYNFYILFLVVLHIFLTQLFCRKPLKMFFASRFICSTIL